jgi:hypothetical protein
MYKAQAGNIVWIATDKDQEIAQEILIKNFQGCQIVEATGEDVFEDFDEVARVKSLRTTEAKVGFMLTKLGREGVESVTLADLTKRFGWKPTNQKSKGKASKAAIGIGWEYIATVGGHHATPACYRKIKT